MKFKYHRDFKKAFKILPASIKRKFYFKIELFISNQKHPSLNLEKLEPKILNKWSLRIDKTYRLILELEGNNTLFLLDIGPHDAIYKRIK